MAANVTRALGAIRRNKFIREVSWALIGQSAILAGAVILAVIVVRSVA